ncbi:hypothetical protein J6590_011551 [Homalodisca vitripennis]|nr:hypothetical protein J6590_011551 [Homalodisca vitripennis]
MCAAFPRSVESNLINGLVDFPQAWAEPCHRCRYMALSCRQLWAILLIGLQIELIFYHLFGAGELVRQSWLPSAPPDRSCVDCRVDDNQQHEV